MPGSEDKKEKKIKTQSLTSGYLYPSEKGKNVNQIAL